MQQTPLHHLRLSMQMEFVRTGTNLVTIDGTPELIELAPGARAEIRWESDDADWITDTLRVLSQKPLYPEPGVYVESLVVGTWHAFPTPARLYPKCGILHFRPVVICLNEPAMLVIVHDGSHDKPAHVRAALVVERFPVMVST
jgi:hypothetical protein